MKPKAPPRLAEALLALAAPACDREEMLGDLAEEFAIRATLGPARARRWYWRQVLGSLPANLLRLARAERSTRGGDGPLASALHDLRAAARTLARRPGLAAVLIGTLGIGVGASTVVFGLVRSLLLRPLPYRDPERLALVWGSNPRVGQRRDVISGPSFLELHRNSRSFEGLAAFKPGDLTLRGPEGARIVSALQVTPEFFEVLGVAPLLGRLFEQRDGQAGSRVALLSHGAWQRHFGGDPAVVGRTLQDVGQPHVVVGVLPAGYRFFEDHDLVLPLSPALLEREPPTYYNYWVLGRLKPRVAFREAESELDGILARVALEHANLRGWEASVDPLQELLVEPVKPALVFLSLAAAVLMLIGCANAANLLLARFVDRARELAARAALGASPWRIARGLLAEQLLVALAAGLLGWFVAALALDALAAAGPAAVAVAGSAATVSLAPLELDLTVFAFALLLACLSPLAFGLLPAWNASRLDLVPSLGGGRASDDPARARLRSALLVAQTALATALLVACGLMLRSVVSLLEADPGYSLDRVATMSVGRAHDLEPQQRVRYYERVLESVRGLAGVRAAGLNDYLPLQNEDDYEGFEIEGRPARPGGLPREEWRRVGGDYFQALQLRLVRGRGLRASDDAGAPSVALVNEALARKYFPGEDPLGRRLRITHEAYGWSEIVGVVADAREASLDREAKPMVFVPYQRAPRPMMGLFVKTDGDPLALLPSLRRAVAAADPAQPVSEEATLDSLAWRSLAVRRLTLALLAVLAALALLLTVAGVFAVLSHVVARRSREIGMRMALGATRSDVLRLVLGGSLRLAALGTALGALAALGLARWQASLLYAVSPADPVTLGGVSVLVLAAALAACAAPALRAAALDPLAALRRE